MVAIKHDITLTELLNRALRKELEATKMSERTFRIDSVPLEELVVSPLNVRKSVGDLTDLQKSIRGHFRPCVREKAYNPRDNL